MKNITSTSTRIILFILFFTFLSGVLRKWIFLDSITGNIIFFFQIIAPYIFLFNGVDKLGKVSTNSLLVLFFFFLAISCFNPLLISLYAGLLGFIFHFCIWFLFYYYVENRNEFNVASLNKSILVLIIIQLTLAFIQYKSPQGSFINRYSSEENVGGIIAEVGNAVRVTGTFSYISGFSAFLIFHVFFTWSLIIREFKPLLTISLLFFGFIGCLMNGSRGATYIYILINIFFFFFEAKKTNIISQISKVIIPFILVFALFLNSDSSNLGQTILKSFDNFQLRRNSLSQNGEESKRIFNDYYRLKDFKGLYPIFGIGIGSAYQGSIILYGRSDALIEYGFIESELEKYVLEGGFVLLFLRLLLTVHICTKFYLPRPIKILIGLLFFITPITYNIFNIIFLFLGVLFIDQAYYNKSFLKYPR